MYTNTYLNSEQLQKSVIEIFYFTRSIFLFYNNNIRLHYISSRVHSRSNQFVGSRQSVAIDRRLTMPFCPDFEILSVTRRLLTFVRI